jgi:hypothetical protein
VLDTGTATPSVQNPLWFKETTSNKWVNSGAEAIDTICDAVGLSTNNNFIIILMIKKIKSA